MATAGESPLPLGLTAAALAAAEAEPDPSSLGAAARLRGRFAPDLAGAALTQVELRRRARVKFGDLASRMFFTRDGLEQASRPEVSAYHTRRFVAAGVTRVVDLGCGIGADAIALAQAGLSVVAVERDPTTADVARANLAGIADVVCADARDYVDTVAADQGVFCDPARRTGAGRVWRVEDFSPGWDLVAGLLDGRRAALVKLGPALPHELVPAGVDAEWVSHRGDTVEVCLAAGDAAPHGGRRSAVVLPDARLLAPSEPPELAVTPPLAYLYEPDGAVIRAGAVTALGLDLGASLLDPKIAYLTGERLVATPFATAFEVLDVLPYQEKLLRRWVAEHRIGALEIKQRGLDLDPASLRRRLRPSGPVQATFVISRTPAGARVLVARRVAA